MTKKRNFWLLALIAVPAVLLVTAFVVDTALARVWDSWDWVEVGGQNKRALKYCIDPDFDADLGNGDIDWTDRVFEAVTNWNVQSTGWTLAELPWDDADCQIQITAGQTGGSLATARCPRAANTRFASFCIIKIDPTPGRRGIRWGKDDGSDAETTYNPVTTLTHELGHAMRLDHHRIGRIMVRAFSAGADDNFQPNNDDIQEAVDSVTAPIRVAMGAITPQAGAFVSIDDSLGNLLATVDIPPGAVTTPLTISASVDNYVSTPDSDAVPGGITPVFRSLYLSDELGNPVVLLLPATIVIHYGDMFDSVTGDERTMEQAVVPSGSGLPGVSEKTLRVLTRAEGIGNAWEPVLTPSIDTAAHTATFSINEVQTYGLAGEFEGPNVGGVAELPEVAGAPLETAGSSGSNTGLIAGVVAAITAGTIALSSAAWYGRRRLTRS